MIMYNDLIKIKFINEIIEDSITVLNAKYYFTALQ